MTRSARVGPEELGRALSRLRQEGRDSLVQRWTDLYGIAPPPRTSRSLLTRSSRHRRLVHIQSNVRDRVHPARVP
jgi:hypothetical protein